jgi:outer membrane autotransporter protein
MLRYSAEGEQRKLQGAQLADAMALGAGFRPSAGPKFSPFDIWIEGKYASFRDNRASSDLDGHFGLVSVGADYVLSRSFLVGTMVQFDSMRQHSNSQATEVSGQGWMVGPYATLRLTDNVFWQARAAWGQSSNEVSPFLTYTDKFHTDRWLVSSTLTGRWGIGPWVLRPSASVAYIEDVSKSYIDTFGVAIPEVKSRLGQAKAGPEIGYRYQLGHGVVLEPRAGLQVIWNFAGDTTANGFTQINGDPAGPVGVRGRAEIGLRASTSGGIGLDLSGSYDGIGAKDYDAFTGRATVRVPLN